MKKPVAVEPVLTPRGRLYLSLAPDAPALDADLAERLMTAFDRGSGHGLLRLGSGEPATVLPPPWAFWRDFGGYFVTALCHLTDADEYLGRRSVHAPPREELEPMVSAAPPMTGSEYLSADTLKALWSAMNNAFRIDWSQSGMTVQQYLQKLNPAWNLVGRVHFNLSENRKNVAAPFSFLATYTHRLTAHGRAQHLPLGQALEEYAGRTGRSTLFSLLLPVHRAAASCPWLKEMIDRGEIFRPVSWTSAEASRFLQDIPILESAGIIVRMPAGWSGNRPPRPVVTASIDSPLPSILGRDALLGFRMEVTLEGEPLAPAEIESIIAETEGLALVRGRWVEVDGRRLRAMLERFRKIERRARLSGLSFGEAQRLLSGVAIEDGPLEDEDIPWAEITAGPWLARTLKGLRSPEGLTPVDPGPALKTELRSYQKVGLQWLHLLQALGLGACLADDMGLGKTIQVLALLLVLKEHEKGGNRPNLLVAPASILANWASEIGRFAPGLSYLIVHTSSISPDEMKVLSEEKIRNVDLVITSYGTLLRVPGLMGISWNLVVLDEAQAIRNPLTKQSRQVKRLDARARIALTGTPVENRAKDLWSLFDFLNPGLLGSSQTFSRYVRSLQGRTHNPFGPLRELVRPYILRRLKTDRAVIADLPEKTELTAWCALTKKQAVLYQQAVKDLAQELKSAAGIQRKGVVLAALMRFKQICNHPSQWLGDDLWAEADSGKLARLREITEVIASRQEKVLVFTQFREVTAPLAAFLAGVFGRSGVVLHGGTPVRWRKEVVRRFQEDERVPFFVLSLKAGGFGLNLTAATHVIHFDRWWNPAVEDQATDRAFRIGQVKNVLVHKFVCRGTVEEKIEALIASKRKIFRDLLEDGAEAVLTEMSDEEILGLVSLDIHHALKED